MHTTDAEGFVTEGMFNGLHVHTVQDIDAATAQLRTEGWPEIEVIALRDAKISAMRVTTAALRAELATA